MQPESVASLAGALVEAGMRVYLETNGTLVDALKSVLALVDVVAMDIKLPSNDCGDLWETHREFLRTCIEGPNRPLVFTKSVVTAITPLAEIEQAAKLMAEIAPNAPFVIQPVAQRGEGPAPPDAAALLAMHTAAACIHANTRLIPQCHPALGLV